MEICLSNGVPQYFLERWPANKNLPCLYQEVNSNPHGRKLLIKALESIKECYNSSIKVDLTGDMVGEGNCCRGSILINENLAYSEQLAIFILELCAASNSPKYKQFEQELRFVPLHPVEDDCRRYAEHGYDDWRCYTSFIEAAKIYDPSPHYTGVVTDEMKEIYCNNAYDAHFPPLTNSDQKEVSLHFSKKCLSDAKSYETDFPRLELSKARPTTLDDDSKFTEQDPGPPELEASIWTKPWVDDSESPFSMWTKSSTYDAEFPALGSSQK